MGRKLRFIPEGGALVEVTCRTLNGQYFLRPDDESRSIFLGILGRAQEKYGMRICSLVVMSNHFHFLLRPDNAKQLADFMAFTKVNISKEVGRLTGRSGPLWQKRYEAILISDEEGAQVDRLVYQLRHGIKEDLVDHPADWPGIHGLHYWLDGLPLEGLWFDRTKESAARRRGRRFGSTKFATPVKVDLEPLPAWLENGLSIEEVRAEIGRWVTQVTHEERARRESEGREVAGVERVMAIPRGFLPESLGYSRPPAFHTASKAAFTELSNAYTAFAQAHRAASVALRSGDRNARFPDGSFPPAAPFVEPGCRGDGVPGT